MDLSQKIGKQANGQMHSFLAYCKVDISNEEIDAQSVLQFFCKEKLKSLKNFAWKICSLLEERIKEKSCVLGCVTDFRTLREIKKFPEVLFIF